MNGYNYPSHNTDRQPQSLPSVAQLKADRTFTNGGPPSPGQHLPPLNQSFQSSSTHLPSLSARPAVNAPSNYQPSPVQYASEKNNHMSQLASQQPALSAHQYPPHFPSYSVHQNYPLPSSYQSGDSNYSASHTFPPPLSQPPSFAETSHNHSASNLLAPFNPQPSQQQAQTAGHDSGLQEQRPLPVVGSQGRRGVLPSAPGRPPIGQGVEIRGQLANSAVKDADGKYHCQFCSKIYLHLKHLKRHHLRHTGERPYQCSLCKETFCRSDILKRHFQKCSIRRGNPTGASHLTHAQDHIRRGSQTPAASATASVAGATQTNGATVAGQSIPPSSYRPNWPGGTLPSQAGPDAGSARTSRSSSVVRRPGSAADDRKSMISTAGTAPVTGQTSVNPSPSSSGGEERKYAQQMPVNREMPSSHYHDQQHTSGPQQYGGHYNAASHQYPTTAQTDFPGFGYGQTNGYNYQQQHEVPRFGDQNWSNYSQYFQAGSQDPVMSYQQHH